MYDEDICFQNAGITLAGTLTLPSAQGPHPAIVVTHTSSAPTRDFYVYQHLARLLAEHGVAVFVFDRRGSGASGGDFETASFDDLAADARAALALLKGRADMDARRLGLWGMSQGGWIAPLAAGRSDAAFVIAVSACGLSPAEQMNYSAEFALHENGFSEEAISEMLALRALIDEVYRGMADTQLVQAELDAYQEKEWYPLAYLDEILPDRPGKTKWALEMDFDPLPMMQDLTVPILLLYGENDPWIPLRESIGRWLEHGPQETTVERIPDANHFMISIKRAGIYGDCGPFVKAYEDRLVDWVTAQVS